MGSIVVPAILRFSRVTVDNLYQINKSLNRLPHASYIFSWRRQHFGTITEEKNPDATDVPPISEATIENEKKLKTELELIKQQKELIKEQQVLVERIKEQQRLIIMIKRHEELITELKKMEDAIEMQKRFIREQDELNDEEKEDIKSDIRFSSGIIFSRSM